MRVKIGKEWVLKLQAKHALKVHIWAAISRRGATCICVFDQNMDGPLYVSILEEFLLPFLIEKFSDGHCRFMQDNDPKHTRTFMLKKKSIGGKHLQAVRTYTQLSEYGES